MALVFRRPTIWLIALFLPLILLIGQPALSSAMLSQAGVPPAESGGITIGESSTPPTVDGSCFSFGGEYTDASQVAFVTQGGWNTLVYAKHTATDLYICMDYLTVPSAGTEDGPNAAVYLDRLGTGGLSPNSDTIAFSISYTGDVQANRGSNDGYNGPDPSGYSIARALDLKFGVWSAEFRISRSVLGGGSWDRQIGLAFANQWVQFVGDDYGWPSGYNWYIPNTWGTGTLITEAAPGSVDFTIGGMEVTQAIQDMGNSVVLVSGKRTFVRVYANTTEARSNVSARLYGFRGGMSLGPPLLPVNPGGAITLYTSPNRGVLNDSFYFELPASWITDGVLTLRADVNPLRNPLESNYANNSYETSVSFVPTNPLQMRLRNIEYTHQDGRLISASDFHQGMLESQLRRMYPISTLISTRRWLRVLTPDNPLVGNIGGAAGYVNGLMNRARNVDGGDPGWVHFGMVSNDGGFMRGQTPWTPAWETASPTGGTPFCPGNGGPCWDSDGSFGDWYGAHELGHALGRPHVGRILGGNIGCGADWWFFMEEYPYDHARIGGNSPFPFSGFDVGDPGRGISPSVISPFWTDVMSYCSYEWISDFTYTRLRTYINNNFPTTVEIPTHSQRLGGDYLAVYGTVDFVHQTADLPIVSYEGSVSSLPPLTPGDYDIRLLDVSDTPVAIYAFTPITSTDSPEEGSIQQIVTFVPGTRRIAIVNNTTNHELASIAVSAKSPVVSNVALTGGPNVPATGPISVSWQGSDADGDNLTYDLKYSFDSGSTWRTLTMGITGNSFPFDASALEGTNGAMTALLQVVANDGVLTGYANSAVFSVGGKAPEITIVSPESDSEYGYGQTVTLEGYAQDFEDGTLTDGNVWWESSLDGYLGLGHLLHPPLLSAGVHNVTFNSIDSHGQFASDSVTVIILDDASLLLPTDPTLEVAPLGTVFLGYAGEPNPDSQVVSIRDLSGTATTWTASTSESWVMLSATSGSFPADIMVSVDTTGMITGSTRTAYITINSPGAINSPQVVNLTVQMEGPWPQMLFLPITINP